MTAEKQLVAVKFVLVSNFSGSLFVLFDEFLSVSFCYVMIDTT